MDEYKIYRVNKFNDEIIQDIVAIFYDKELAIDFMEYQFSLCNRFALFYNGERIDFE